MKTQEFTMPFRPFRIAGVVVCLLGVLLSDTALAQATQSYCPGLRNPTSFATPSTGYGKWSGQTGNKPTLAAVAPNVTGMNMTSQVYNGNELATLVPASSSTSYCGSTVEPTKRFRIMSSTEGPGTGTQRGTDPISNYQLPYVPSSYDAGITSSIRLGNCATGAEAEGLYYTMTVRPQNAMLIFYYCILAQLPHNNALYDPTFCIRVCSNTGTDANPVWTPISDTLSYFVPTTGLQNNVNGWHSIGSGSSTIMWREWNKVAINVFKYMYEKIRVEIFMGDCSYSGHYGYCYVAGDCQPVSIGTSGCPAGTAARVQTLTGPTGLREYVWYRSDQNGSEIPNEANPPSNITWRRLTPAANSNNQVLDTSHRVYDCVINDFRIMAGDGAGDYTNDMVFRCDMKSAVDPAKPYWNSAYVRVNNIKPMTSIDTLKDCDSWLQLLDKSYVPGGGGRCDTNITRWTIHVGSMANSPVDTVIYGGKVGHTFDQAGTYAVDIRTYNYDDTSCYTDETYRVKVLGRPDPVLTVEQHNICEGERATLRDDTPGAVRRDWIVHHDGRIDTIISGPNPLIRGFDSTYENRIEMVTYNGLYYDDSVITGLKHYCTSTTDDTVYLFSHPQVLRTGDSIVCKGDKTRIHVEAKGIDSCTYKWYRQLNGTTPIASGQLLQVAPYSDSCTYYVKVVSPQQCVAWDSVHAYLVLPTLRVDRNVICEGETVTLTSGAAASFSWSATPADALLNTQLDSAGNGPSVVTARPRSTTVYSLVGHGTNGCSTTPLTETVEVHPLPVARVSYDPLFVDSDNPVVTFNDVSPHGVATQWFFPNMEEPIVGSPYTHDFGEVSDDSVRVTLVSANDLGCTDTLKFRLPVELFTFYAPNVFTPDRPDNTVFRIYTRNSMEHFHVHIYDRKGRLMYTSDDLNFEWDGKSLEGTPCSQGTYVFVITYRRPNTEDIVTQKGTVTLLR